MSKELGRNGSNGTSAYPETAGELCSHDGVATTYPAEALEIIERLCETIDCECFRSDAQHLIQALRSGDPQVPTLLIDTVRLLSEEEAAEVVARVRSSEGDQFADDITGIFEDIKRLYELIGTTQPVAI